MATPEEYIEISDFSPGIHGDWHGSNAPRYTADVTLAGALPGNGAARVEGTERCRADKTGALVPLPKALLSGVLDDIEPTLTLDPDRPYRYILDAQVGQFLVGQPEGPVPQSFEESLQAMWGFWCDTGSSNFVPVIIGREYRPWIAYPANGEAIFDFMYGRSRQTIAGSLAEHFGLPIGSLANARFYLGNTASGINQADNDPTFRPEWMFPVSVGLIALPYVQYSDGNALQNGAITGPERTQFGIAPGTDSPYTVWPPGIGTLGRGTCAVAMGWHSAFIEGSAHFTPIEGLLQAQDDAVFDILGDITLVAKLTPDDWSTAAQQDIISRWNPTTNQRAYRFVLGTANTLVFEWSTDGTAVTTRTSASHAAVLTNGEPMWIAVTLDVNNGAAGNDTRFWTSPDGIAWTQLGGTITGGGVTSIFNATTTTQFGGTVTAGNYQGHMHNISIRNGVGALGVVGGTEVFAFGPADFPPGNPQSFLDPVADVQVSVSQRSRIAHVDFNGSVQRDLYLTVANSGDVNIVGDLTITIRAAMTDWTPASSDGFVAKNTELLTQQSFEFFMANTGALQLDAWDASGTIQSFVSSVATGFTNGTIHWVAATLDVDNGAAGKSVRFWTSDDGVVWTQLGATQTTATPMTIFESATALTVGGRSGTIPNAFEGQLYDVSVRSGIGPGGTVSGLEVFGFGSADIPDGNPATFTARTGATVVVGQGTPATVLVEGSPGLELRPTLPDLPGYDDMSGFPIPQSTSLAHWYFHYSEEDNIPFSAALFPDQFFADGGPLNPYLLVAHQGRVVIPDRRRTRQAFVDNSDGLPKGYLDSFLFYSDYALPCQDPFLFPLGVFGPAAELNVPYGPFPETTMTPYNTLLVAEDDNSEIGTVGVVTVDQILVVKARAGGAVVSGDLDNPSIRRLPYIEPTGGVICKGVHTPIGFVYGSINGIYIWQGGDTTEKLSRQIDGFFWNHTDGSAAEQYAGSRGRMAYWNQFILVPNNFLFDTETNGWWRFSVPDMEPLSPNLAPYNCFDVDSRGTLYAFPYRNIPDTVDPLPVWHTFDQRLLDNEYSWTSHPLIQTQGRTLTFQCIEMLATAKDDAANTTIEVTLEGFNLDGELTTSSITQFHLDGSPEPQLLKRDITPNFQGEYVTIRLRAVESNTDLPAPKIHAIRLGYKERARQVRNG